MHFPSFLSHLSLHCLLSAGVPEQSLSHLSLWFLHLFLQLLADTVVIITRPTTSRTIRNLVYNNMEVKQILSVGGAVHSDKSHVFILTFMFMLLSLKKIQSIISFNCRKIKQHILYLGVQFWSHEFQQYMKILKGDMLYQMATHYLLS